MPYKKSTPGGGQVFTSGGRVIDVARAIYTNTDANYNAIAMTYAHGAVHKDTIINASHYAASADGDLLFFFVSGVTLQVHLEYLVVAAGICRVRFYENPAILDAGTQVPGVRLYRPTAKTTQSLVTFGGTVVAGDYGTLLKDQSNGGGGGGANTRGGSAVHSDAEWILKPNFPYCLRLTRTGAQITSVEFEWYEVGAV